MLVLMNRRVSNYLSSILYEYIRPKEINGKENKEKILVYIKYIDINIIVFYNLLKKSNHPFEREFNIFVDRQPASQRFPLPHCACSAE